MNIISLTEGVIWIEGTEKIFVKKDSPCYSFCQMLERSKKFRKMIKDETILNKASFSPFIPTEQDNSIIKNSEDYDSVDDYDSDDDDDEDEDEDEEEVNNETYEIENSNQNFTGITFENTSIRHRQNTVELPSLKTTIFDQKSYQDLDSVHICISAEDDNREADKWLQLQDPSIYQLFERFQVFQGMDKTIVSALTTHIDFLEQEQKQKQKQKQKQDSKQKENIQESELKLKTYKVFLLWCQQNLGKLGDSQILLQKCLTLFGQLIKQLTVEPSLSDNAQTLSNKAKGSLEEYLKAECNIYEST